MPLTGHIFCTLGNMQLNLIDIFLILIFVLAVWSGWRKGFIVGTLGLITWIGSLVAAFIFYPSAAGLLDNIFPSLGVWLLPVAFIGIVIISGILLSFIARRIISHTPLSAHKHSMNKILGVLPGALNAIIWGTIISALLLTVPIANGISAKSRDSVLADKLADDATWIEAKMAPVFDDAVNETISKLTIRPDPDKSYDLDFTVDDPELRTDLESRMLDLVNEERRKRGIKEFVADPEMATVARKHSRDMFARGYFSHHTPEGLSPFDRMTRDKVQFLTAGENLALAQTLTQAHLGLMNSPGHRANILNPSYGRLGIGVLDGGFRGLMITQNFRN